MSELFYFNAEKSALELVGGEFSYIANVVVTGYYVVVSGLSKNGTPLERGVYFGKGAFQ